MGLVASRVDHARLRYYALRHRDRLTLGSNVRIARGLRLDGGGRIVIGDRTMFDAENAPNFVYAGTGATVLIGPDCYFNGVSIVANEDVTIGPRCVLGPGCLLMTSDWHSTSLPRNGPDADVRSGPIRLGSDVWLAAGSSVLRGVTIGDRAVVALGTVVTRDVPEAVLVASHQQRVVRHLEDRQ